MVGCSMSVCEEKTCQMILDSASKQLAEADALHDIYCISSEFTGELDFQYFQYSLVIPVSLQSPEYLHVNNLPVPWWTQYRKDGLIDEDPIFRYCMEQNLPLLWQDASNYLKTTNDIRFMHLASQHGIHDGVSIPIHSGLKRNGVLSFIYSNSRNGITASDVEAMMPYLSLFAVHMQAAIDRNLVKHEPQEIVELSEREKECLYWSAEGKTTEETADILDISASTVTFHMRNIIRKLNVSNRQQAIAKVILLGIISPRIVPVTGEPLFPN